MTMPGYRRKSCTVCGRYENNRPPGVVTLTRWKNKEWRCQKCLPKTVKTPPEETQLSFEKG